MSKGVIYCAIGKKYIDQVIVSANGVKKHNPDLKVALFSDQIINHPSIDINIDIFDYPTGKEDFELLKNSDRLPSMKIMMCHMLFTSEDDCEFVEISDGDTWRHSVAGFLNFSKADWYNAGVIAYNKKPEVTNFLNLWRDVITGNSPEYSYLYEMHDQNILNNLISMHALNGVNYSGTVLHNKEYNATDRIWCALKKIGEWENAKILHSNFNQFLKEYDEGNRSYDDLTDHEYFDIFR